MEQVDKLNQVFGEFLNRKKLLSKSPHSLHLPDGIQTDYFDDDLVRRSIGTGTGALQSIESGGKPGGARGLGHLDESTIHHIITDHHSSQETYLNMLLRQQEEHLSKYNAQITQLKRENVAYEQTVLN